MPPLASACSLASTAPLRPSGVSAGNQPHHPGPPLWYDSLSPVLHIFDSSPYRVCLYPASETSSASNRPPPFPPPPVPFPCVSPVIPLYPSCNSPLLYSTFNSPQFLLPLCCSPLYGTVSLRVLLLLLPVGVTTLSCHRPLLFCLHDDTEVTRALLGIRVYRYNKYNYIDLINIT